MANEFGIDMAAVKSFRNSQAQAQQAQQINALKMQQAQQQIAGNQAKAQQAQQTKNQWSQFGQSPNKQAVIQQTYSIDPKAAQEMQKQVQQMDENQRKQAEWATEQTGKLAAGLMQVPDAQFDQAYLKTLMGVAQKVGPKAIGDAPPMNASLEEKRAWVQQQANEAMSMQQILDQSKPNKLGKPMEAVDANGNPVFIQPGPDGSYQPLQGYTPPQKQKGLFVKTGPDGTVISTNGMPPQNQQLAKTAATAVQKDLAGLEETFARVIDIDNRYNSNFMTYQGQVGAALSAIKDKASIDLSDEEKGFLKDFTKFRTMVNRDFNAYRKEITGAAASVQELESLKKATIAESQSPAEFEANLEIYKDELLRAMRIKRRLLREGLSVGSQSFGDAMDKYYLNGQDDDGEQRYAELQAQGFEEAAILERMIGEGYE